MLVSVGVDVIQRAPAIEHAQPLEFRAGQTPGPLRKAQAIVEQNVRGIRFIDRGSQVRTQPRPLQACHRLFPVPVRADPTLPAS